MGARQPFLQVSSLHLWDPGVKVQKGKSPTDQALETIGISCSRQRSLISRNLSLQPFAPPFVLSLLPCLCLEKKQCEWLLTEISGAPLPCLPFAGNTVLTRPSSGRMLSSLLSNPSLWLLACLESHGTSSLSLCRHVSLRGLSCRVCGIPAHTRVSICWPLGENGEEEEQAQQSKQWQCSPQGCTLKFCTQATHLPNPSPSPATDWKMLLLAQINSKEDTDP